MITPTGERQLTTSLEEFASQATAPHDGRARVSARLATRRRRRRTAAVACVALVVGGIGVGIARLPDTNQSGVATADMADDSASEASPSSSAEADLPNLAVDVPGFVLAEANIGETTFTDEQLAGPRAFYYFQSFRGSADDWQLPGVFVFTTTPDRPFAIGDDNPDQVTTVDINGSPGYLHGAESGAPSLGWRLEDGTTAFIEAPGMDSDDLLAFARSMQARPDRQGWDVETLPEGLAPIVDAANTSRPATAHNSLRYESPDGRVELNSSLSTPVQFEDRVADYLNASIDVENTTVRGQPAVVIRSEHDTRVLWFEPDADVQHYFIIDGSAEDQVDEIIAGLSELPSTEWAELLDSTDTTYWNGDTPSSTSLPSN